MHVDSGVSLRSVSVSWIAGQGVCDAFRVLLHDERGLELRNVTLPRVTLKYEFTQLTPGRKYRILIHTLSGGIQSKVEITHTRTSESLILFIKVVVV